MLQADGWSALAAWLGLSFAILGGLGAWKAYRLAARHEALLRGDEELIAGPLQRPELRHTDHSKCVLSVHLVNRSQRQVVVKEVRVLQPDGQGISITWSDRIDSVGNPEGVVGGPLLVSPTMSLFLRRDDGKAFAEGTVVKVFHGFKGSPIVLKHSSDGGWLGWAES